MKKWFKYIFIINKTLSIFRSKYEWNVIVLHWLIKLSVEYQKLAKSRVTIQKSYVSSTIAIKRWMFKEFVSRVIWFFCQRRYWNLKTIYFSITSFGKISSG